VDSRLYPEYRVAADLYQSLGHGWEVSGGYRHLQFATGTNIATWSLSKYYGNWLFTGRMYITPGDVGVSKSGTFSARRFFGKEGLHDYVEFRFSQGASIALARTQIDTISLNSTRFGLTFDKTIGHWAINLAGGAGTEELIFGNNMNRYTGGATIYYRF
jgi:YaiO family outer membrane protein